MAIVLFLIVDAHFFKKRLALCFLIFIFVLKPFSDQGPSGSLPPLSELWTRVPGSLARRAQQARFGGTGVK